MNANVANSSTLTPVVYAATTVVPKPLITPVAAISPTAMKQLCKPMVIPILVTSLSCLKSGLNSCRDM